MEKLLLTVNETAKLLSLSRSKVYELMVNSGSDYLPSVHIGSLRRIKVTELRAWVQRQEDAASLETSGGFLMQRQCA